MIDSKDTFKFTLIPNNVGGYEIVKNCYIMTVKKSNLIHRLFCKLLLGWRWVNTNKEGSIIK